MYLAEFQGNHYLQIFTMANYSTQVSGGALDGWGGVGLDKCWQLTGPEFVNVSFSIIPVCDISFDHIFRSFTKTTSLMVQQQ
jgi:hypothetical protein